MKSYLRQRNCKCKGPEAGHKEGDHRGQTRQGLMRHCEDFGFTLTDMGAVRVLGPGGPDPI